MEYATGDAQKGPVLLESPLKGMISSSKLQRPSDSPEHRDNIALQLPTFTSMKSSLYRSHLVVNFS